jgi:hypothetical protein
MNDKITLWFTAVFTLFFFVTGLLDLLDHSIVKTILFTGFLGIVVNIILVKSKNGNQKNLPE